ncbi:hypothetical protein Tco_0802031 [Tanacetum coccineum]|uniref:Uncharacterized protein n=1 Tax=Tanacetum coccineum TaxID=301880 RepID=A0ABQ5A1X9_9ASTR
MTYMSLYCVSIYEYAISTLRTKGLNFYNLCAILVDFADMAPLPPRNQRHLWLRYQLGSERLISDKRDLSDYWVEISSGKDFLRGAPSYTYIRDPVRRHTEGRKSVPRLFRRSHYLDSFAHHFGLVSNDGLRGLFVMACELPLIGMGKLVKLNICIDLGYDLVWVAPGPERQQRLGRLEEEVQGLRRDIRSLRGLVERSMTDQGRFSTWMISCMAQLLDASGLTYQAFDGTF